MHLQEKQPLSPTAQKPFLGLYCHIPFCASTCDFCSFYQEKPKRGDLDRYLDAMDCEFKLLPKNRIIDTVFWGGGTPGLLSAKDLERLGSSMLKQMIKPPVEWTIEMAPSTVKVDKLKVLKDLGVTRISMGVQSFDPLLLASLGRLHNPKQIYTAWERIQATEFPQTNLDLIFAIPNQSIEQWESDIREAAALGPEHLSSYCLTFEEDTALYIKLSQGKVRMDEAKELQFYELGWQLLAEQGYFQYEVSNFSKPGSECLHNIHTWQMHEWIGCGPSAASQYRNMRYQRPADLTSWIDGMSLPDGARTEVVSIDDAMLFTDALVFGLRMNSGIQLDEIYKRFPSQDALKSTQRLFKTLTREGLVQMDTEQERVLLTHSGRLVCDAIGSAIIEAVNEA